MSFKRNTVGSAIITVHFTPPNTSNQKPTRPTRLPLGGSRLGDVLRDAQSMPATSPKASLGGTGMDRRSAPRRPHRGEMAFKWMCVSKIHGLLSQKCHQIA